MHRYEELERLYYKRLFFRIFLFFLGIIILIGVVAFFYSESLEEVKVKEVNISEVKPIKKEDVKREDVKKEPAIKKESTNDKKKIEIVNFILPEIKENLEKQVEKKIEKKEVKKVSLKNGVKNDIIKEKVVNVKYLIERFNQNPSLDLALMIANEYLKESNLSEAKNWALKANNINPQDERSWIIFADILLKKGNIKKAKEILNFYIDSYGKNDKIENKLRSLNAK